MPTDDLNVEGTPEQQPATPPAEGTPPATPPATPSAEEVATQLANQVGEQNKPVLEALQTITQYLEKQATPETPPLEASELAEKLLTDPDTTLNTKIMEVLKQQLAPTMTRDYEIDRDERIDARAAEIDQEFGEGWFDTNVRSQIVGENGSLKAYPINQQADPNTIELAISNVMGVAFRDPEKRAEMNDAISKTRKEREVRTPPNLMGPGRPMARPTNALTPEMKASLEGFQRAGVKVSEKDILTAMSRGRSLEDWQQAEQ
jgi:hypothetical protein